VFLLAFHNEFYRELFEQAFISPHCAFEFSSMNISLSEAGAVHRAVRPVLKSISDAQALFFVTKGLLNLSENGTLNVNDSKSSVENLLLDLAQVLLTKKGGKLGRDFDERCAEEVLKLASSLGQSPKHITFAALFARLAFRLGKSAAKELLLKMSESSSNPSLDATYFLARILQKSEKSHIGQYERMYKKVEASSCASAPKAKYRLLALKWPKPIAALRIYVWFLKKRRKRSVQTGATTLRDFVGLVCEAELKLPYSFCEAHNTAALQLSVLYAVTFFFAVHWKSPTQALLDFAAFGEALPCADGISRASLGSDSDDSAKYFNAPA